MDFQKNKAVYFMFLPVVIFYLVFHYYPMSGIILAFKDFKPALGIWGSHLLVTSDLNILSRSLAVLILQDYNQYNSNQLLSVDFRISYANLTGDYAQ